MICNSSYSAKNENGNREIKTNIRHYNYYQFKSANVNRMTKVRHNIFVYFFPAISLDHLITCSLILFRSFTLLFCQSLCLSFILSSLTFSLSFIHSMVVFLLHTFVELFFLKYRHSHFKFFLLSLFLYLFFNLLPAIEHIPVIFVHHSP